MNTTRNTEAAINDAVEHAETARAHIAWRSWADRDPVERVKDGNTAMAEIDAALKALHAARTALMTERRKEQDEAMAHAEAFLAQYRESGEQS